MKVDVGVTYSPEFQRLLNLNDDVARAVMARALTGAAAEGSGYVAEDTPRGPNREDPNAPAYLAEEESVGQLAATITYKPATPDDLHAAIFTNKHYAPYVEWGTGVHSDHPDAARQPIVITAGVFTGRPNYKRALAFRWGGRFFIRRSVTIQGQHPAAMFRGNAARIQSLFEALLAQGIQDYLTAN